MPQLDQLDLTLRNLVMSLVPIVRLPSRPPSQPNLNDDDHGDNDMMPMTMRKIHASVEGTSQFMRD